jgi:hypothetical protein
MTVPRRATHCADCLAGRGWALRWVGGEIEHLEDFGDDVASFRALAGDLARARIDHEVHVPEGAAA